MQGSGEGVWNGEGEDVSAWGSGGRAYGIQCERPVRQKSKSLEKGKRR